MKIWLGALVLSMVTLSTNAVEVDYLLSRKNIAFTVGVSVKASRQEVINVARDFVYQRAGMHPMPSPDTSSEALYLLAVDNKLPRSCGQMARTYQWILEQFGISSRRVDLYAQTYMQGQ